MSERPVCVMCGNTILSNEHWPVYNCSSGKQIPQKGKAVSDTPRTDALVEKHQRELRDTRASSDPIPILKLAQDQAIESMVHARAIERENAALRERIAELEGAREDTERLTFYANNPDKVLNVGTVWYSREKYGGTVTRRKSLRHAIDATRKVGR